MTAVDLVNAVAAAYRADRNAAGAEQVLGGSYEIIGPRTLQRPSGLLVTWMACGCVVAHRKRRVGRRLLICGTCGEGPFLFHAALERDSGGRYELREDAA